MRARCIPRLALAAALAAPLLLSSCATLPPAGTPTAAPAHPAGPAGPAQFHQKLEADGRLSVRYERDGKEESLTGSFRWFQAGEDIDIVLLSPLNQTLARISATPREAVLQEAGKPVRIAPDLESLTFATLGWPLPAAGLRGWLQGYELRGGQSLPLAVPGQEDAPPVETAGGWQIQYARWQQEDNGAWRPRRIDVTRQAGTADAPYHGPLSIRLVIDRWQPLD